MTLFVGQPGSPRKQKLNVFNLLKKVLTVVLLSFLLVTVSDTLSSARMAPDDQNPPQLSAQGFGASNPSCADNSQHGNLLSLAARYGIAKCYGSNGPTPIHVCLTDEMGIGYNSFYGLEASLNFADRNDYGATVCLDVNRLQFHGNGRVTETREGPTFPLIIGDSLSGDITTTIASVNFDFHLGSSFTHVLKFFPRAQFVDYVKDMSLANHTQQWSDTGAVRYALFGVGGVIEFDLVPLWANLEANGIMSALSQDIKASATIGTGGGGVSYWSWNVGLNFLKFPNSALKFTGRDMQISAEAGVSMWQILEPPPTGFNMDEGRVDSLMFFLQVTAAI